MSECSFFNKWRRKYEKCSKSNVLIVVVSLLNAKRAILPKNVPTVHGMNAVVGTPFIDNAL
jgi:hypothetical protein